MRARETTSKETLNFLLSQIKNKKIENHWTITAQEIIKLIKKEIKTIEESIWYMIKAWKDYEIELEKQKIKLLQNYLPTMLTINQTKEIVMKFIKELEVINPQKERWKIIKPIMERHWTVIDGKTLNDIINNLQPSE
jgi:uncharacterized protein YqeY